MQEGLRILLVEDDPRFQKSVVDVVGVYNQVTVAASMAEARSTLATKSFDVVLLDLTLPDGHALPMIREIKGEDCNTIVVVLSGDNSFPTLKSCVTAGADDYVVKSDQIVPDLLVRLPIAVSRGAKDRHAASLEAQFKHIFKQELVGGSLPMAQLREAVSGFASSDSTILITGESGTGKENIARRLHHLRGAKRPFVAFNCGSIPENLVESHLFGHKKGSFTGATDDSSGYFAQAHGGDLFLDEVGELPLQAQSKLLRVLQDRVYFKVGGDREIASNCRVIAATNQDLEEMVRLKKFRKDLFYRLNIIRIKTTPLRDRNEDIRDLSRFLVLKWCGPSLSLSPSAFLALEKHDWPGNIRELENTIQRAKHLAQCRHSKVIEATDIVVDSVLSDSSAGPRRLEAALPSDRGDLSCEHYRDFLLVAEREYLRAALTYCGGRVESTAEALQLHRGTLYRKLGELGLSRLGQLTEPSRAAQDLAKSVGLRRAGALETLASTVDHNLSDARKSD